MTILWLVYIVVVGTTYFTQCNALGDDFFTDTTSTIDPHTDHGNESGTHSSGHAHEGEDHYVMIFIFGTCILGALVRTLLKRLPFPYTVLLMVIGAAVGAISLQWLEITKFTASVVNMDPHLLLHIFLPVLIFESAFAMDVHTFMKSLIQVCILAVGGLLLATVLTAVLAKYVFSAYNWSFNISMMFGAMASATDPVAVVALLKDLGASKQLGTLIEGESLLNDGCSIVVFEIFKNMAVPNAEPVNVWLYFLKVALLAPSFGFAMGKGTTFWLSHIFNDALAEITITLASAYITFYIGEHFRFSGVLSVVILGLIVNAEKTAISPEVEVFLHRFWEMLAYLANTLIFIIVGVVITQKAFGQGNVNYLDWFYLIVLYVGINVIRGVVILTLSPILKRIGYGLSWQNAVVMTWGGLRGAVGLALGLLVHQTPELDQETVGEKVLFLTCGIVAMTLLVNATTVSSLLQILGMSDISIPKRLAMASAIKRVQQSQQRTFAMLKADRFLADADWSIAETACEIEDPYTELGEEMGQDQLVIYERHSTCPKCQTDVPNEPSPKEYADMMEEVRIRLLKAAKVSYWKQFEHGMLTREALRILVGCTETASDTPFSFIGVDELKKNWEITGIYPTLRRWLTDVAKGGNKQSSVIPEPSNFVMKSFYIVSDHFIFSTFVWILIIINLTFVIIGLIIENRNSDSDFLNPLRIMNFYFTGLYILEALIKIVGYRKFYFLDHWCQFDLFIILLSLVDIVIDESLDHLELAINPQVFKLLRLLKFARTLRGLRLIKFLIPRVIIFINRRINRKLSLGYDVGKGYIVGEEEIAKVLDGITDNKNIQRELKRVTEEGRLQAIRELGMLQREHPGIAVSIKTRQSIRTVLNHSRDTIHELQGAGLLDEMEAHKLEMMVEFKMKRLQNAPASIPPPPPESLLRNVPWMTGDTKMINFIKARAELLHFDYQDTIITEGDPPNGVYLIISGLVRLFGHSEYLDHEQPRGSYSTTSEELFEDYLSVGNVIGEMGVLTGKPRNATVTCETAVQVYYINMDDMVVALDTFTLQPSLESRLWRVVAIRVATPLLLKQMMYQGWTQEKVKLHLEKGFQPVIRNNSFDIDYTMEDVILIQGKAINAHSRDEILGPCIIPRTVHRLVFPEQEIEPRLFVVTTVDANENNMSDEFLSRHGSKLSSMIEASAHCIRHRKLSTPSVKLDEPKLFKNKVEPAKPPLVLQPRSLIKPMAPLQPLNKVQLEPLSARDLHGNFESKEDANIIT